MRLVDRRQGRAPVDGREPAGVAVGERIEPLAARLQAADLAQPVLADAAADLGILVADLTRPPVGRLAPLRRGQGPEQRAQIVERPAQVDRRGPRFHQHGVGAGEHRVGGIGRHGQRHAVARGGADQRRAAHDHRADRALGILQRPQVADDELMGQQRLVDRLHRRAVGAEPDGAIGLAVYFHAGKFGPARRRVKRRVRC